MDAIDFLKEVETKYNLQSIKAKDMMIWSFLRKQYFFQILANEFPIYKSNQKKEKLGKRRRGFANVFYGFRNLFRKYNIFISSNHNEQRKIDGKFRNKLTHDLIMNFHPDSTLLLESSITGVHPDQKYMTNKRTLSSNLFFAINKIISFIILKSNFRIVNENILKEINTNYKLHVDYRKYISIFIAYRKLYSIYFKIIKPKMIFVSLYYNLNNQAIIHVGNKMKIPVIEFQHGIISKDTPAYNVFTQLDSSFFPNYLFALGENTRSVFSEENHFIDQRNVFPVGSSILTYYLENRSISEAATKLRDIINPYNRVFAISSQVTIREKLIDQIKLLAMESPNMLFLFVPRKKLENQLKTDLPQNLLIIEDFNVYEIISISDYHLTVYSACAIEAPALGIPNILLDIDGLSTTHFGNILSDNKTTRVIDSIENFLQVVEHWEIGSHSDIMERHRDFITIDHRRNIRIALRKIVKSYNIK